uniref:Putative secreted protein n=1 Tax=Ixodes ricinus TaxID=34613 RepID=A0A6B0U1W6_IXORI
MSSFSLSWTCFWITCLSLAETLYGDRCTGRASSSVTMRCFATAVWRTFDDVAKQSRYSVRRFFSCRRFGPGSFGSMSSCAGDVLSC